MTTAVLVDPHADRDALSLAKSEILNRRLQLSDTEESIVNEAMRKKTNKRLPKPLPPSLR